MASGMHDSMGANKEGTKWTGGGEVNCSGERAKLFSLYSEVEVEKHGQRLIGQPADTACQEVTWSSK